MGCRNEAKQFIEFYVAISMLEPFWHQGTAKAYARTLLSIMEKEEIATERMMLSPKNVENMKNFLRGVGSYAVPISGFPSKPQTWDSLRKDLIEDIAEQIVKCRD